MTRFVLDASVVLTWCFPDEHAHQAQYALSLLQQEGEAVATSFWPIEILNALLMGERRQRITQPLIQAFLADLQKLPVHLDPMFHDTAQNRTTRASVPSDRIRCCVLGVGAATEHPTGDIG